jgi:hypothetical protein
MRDARGLSEHEYTRDVRLPNWGRWGRQDSGKPDNERGASSIYQRGKKDETERDDDAVPEDPNPPINQDDAESLDGWVIQLSELHKQIIRAKFYKRQQVHISDTDAAVRALLDLMGDNRKVVKLMKRLGWT